MRFRPRHTMAFMVVIQLLAIGSAWAANFSHDFENVNMSEIANITLTDGELSADFSGGMVVQTGITQLANSGVRAWIIDPAGVGARGNSTGAGTVTLPANTDAIQFYFRNEDSIITSVVKIVDDLDGVIQEFSGTEAGWTLVEVVRNEGDSRIAEVRVENAGPLGMVAVDDFSFSATLDTAADGTTPPEENTQTKGALGGGGAVDVWFITLLLLLGVNGWGRPKSSQLKSGRPRSLV